LINNIEKNAEAEFLFFYGRVMIKRIIKRFQEIIVQTQVELRTPKIRGPPKRTLKKWASGKAGGSRNCSGTWCSFLVCDFP
jgi:hypothetical protein